MAALTINLLGSFQARLAGEEISTFRTNKVQALLIYLVLEPAPHRRDELMELMWPGMPERSARLNLRQILFHLRSMIPNLSAHEPGGEPVPFIVANRKTIQRNPAADVITDVEHFLQQVDSTMSHDHADLLICPECLQKLEAAVALYRGNFLADFYLDDSNAFEQWVQVCRQAYARKTLDALEVLATVRTRSRRFSEAREFVEAQMSIDNLREGAYRQLMKITALAGQREEALGVYEKCRRILVEELGMEPSRRTTALYEQILAGELSFDTPRTTGVRGFELKEEIGRGAFGITHRAIQSTVAREVVIKIIRREYANDPEFIRRFEEEAHIIASLEHPYVVPLYDFWRDPDGVFLVMRYLRGGSLLSALESGPWRIELAIRLLDQIASALTSAHSQGIVHRDIKPANILFDESGNAYLTDFGIAKDLARNLDLSTVGVFVGTLDYISPEQISDEPVSAQTDIYSLGMVLFEILIGEKPFTDSSVANLIHKQLNQMVPLLSASRPELPVGLDDVMQRATAKDPTDRYATVLEMAEAFRQAASGVNQTSLTNLPTISPALVVNNPYKGLRPFQQADADDYFGRETLVERLITRLGESRFMALVGPSGSGKSSAVKAGLIPALRAGAIPNLDFMAGSRDWYVAEMAPGSHPLEELELALWPIAVDPPVSLVDPMERDTRGMLRTIRRIMPDEPGAQLLLFIDQFEELFTLVNDEERRTFFIDSLLQAIAAPRSPLRVIITLRADFFDRPLQYESLGNLLSNNTEIALPMSAEELTWAIREPARRMGIGVEPTLVEMIKADVTDQPGVLPLLQFTLTELFDRHENRMMTQSAYHAIGGVRGTLGRRASALYQDLSLRRQLATRELFLRLVTLGEGVADTRRRVLRSEIEAIEIAERSDKSGEQRPLIDVPEPLLAGGKKNGSGMSEVIDVYGSARLLTFDHDPKTREPTVEVAHEALLREWSQLRRWLDDNRADIRNQRVLQQAGQAWNESDQDDSYLLRGTRLDLFADWATNSVIALTAAERAFLDASLVGRRTRQEAEGVRRLREVETAQKLAETEQAKAVAEHLRAESEAQSASRFRRLAALLASVAVIAVLLASAAIFFGQAANRSAAEAEVNASLAFEQSTLAATREAEAEGEANRRALAQVAAEKEAEIAFSRELAAAALSTVTEDPERSILLGLQAMSVTYTVAAENALHQAILSSRVRQRWLYPGPGRAYYLDMSPDGRYLVSSGENGALLWDVTEGQTVRQWDINGWINKAEFTADGKLLFLAKESYDNPEEGTITVLEVSSGKEVISFVAHDAGVRYLALSPDGRQLATGGADGIVRLWDIPNSLTIGVAQMSNSWNGNSGSIWGLAFSPDGLQLAAATHDDVAFVWDIGEGNEQHAFHGELSQILNRVIFSPDSRFLLVAGTEGVVDIYDLHSGQRASRTIAHGFSIEDVDFAPSGELLATVATDAQAKLWRYGNGDIQEVMILAGHNARLRASEFSPDGSRLFTSSADGTIRIWDISPSGSEELFTLIGHEGFIPDMDVHQDGSRLVTGSDDGSAIVWDVDTGLPLYSLRDHDGQVNSVAISPDGEMIATASEDLTVKLWEANTGRLLITLAGHQQGNIGNLFQGVMDVEFSPDGTLLATAGADGQARIWDRASGKEIRSFAGHPAGYGLTEVAFSPNGRFLATGSDDLHDDGVVKVWSLDTGEEIMTIGAGRIRIWSVVFSPEGDRIGIADRSGTIDVWSLPDVDDQFAKGMTIERPLFSLSVHSSAASGLRFTADGNQIVTAGIDGKIAFQDSWTGERLLTIDRPFGFFATALSPGGEWLAVGGTDGQVHIFALELETLTSLAHSRLTRSLITTECQQYLHVSECPAASE